MPSIGPAFGTGVNEHFKPFFNDGLATVVIMLSSLMVIFDRFFMGVLLISVCALSAAQSEHSAHQIEWVIPFKANGGSDTWARFVAPHLSKQLPPESVISVINIPGGNSTKAANRYAMNPVLDGTRLLGTSASTQFPFLLGDSRVRYDYDDWQLLLVCPTGGVVYTSPEFGVTKAEELVHLKDHKLIYGSQGPTSLDLVPLLAFELLGLNVRPIFGVRGRDAGRLAFERGDATIDFQTTAAYLSKVKPLVDQGQAIPLFTLGAFNDTGGLIRDPAFPELPHIAEVYEMLNNKAPSGLGWESWFGFFSAGFGAQKILVIPKETPSEIIVKYQQAVASMLEDPEYLQTKDQVLGAYEQVGGQTAEKLYKLATDIPEAQKRWVKEWLKRTYKLNL